MCALSVVGGTCEEHIPDDINIPVGPNIVGEDVVIWYNDHSLRIPHLRLGAELLLEDAKGAGTTDVMGHKLVNFSPDVISRADSL